MQPELLFCLDIIVMLLLLRIIVELLSFQYVKIMLPLFRAVVKFCSTNILFNYCCVMLHVSLLELLLSGQK